MKDELSRENYLSINDDDAFLCEGDYCMEITGGKHNFVYFAVYLKYEGEKNYCWLRSEKLDGDSCLCIRLTDYNYNKFKKL